MLDQSFSAKNFRKIFDYENRKGNNLAGKFFPEVNEVVLEIKKISEEIRNHRKSKASSSSEEYQEKKQELYEHKENLKKKKEDRLSVELNNISSLITEKKFSLKLKEIDIGQSKKAYGFEKSAESYFALKQIQHNLRKLYKIKQGNRHNIVCQLRETLADKLPKHVIRTDISNFYESIPRDKILKELYDDPLLTLTSKKIIRGILHEYEKISDTNVGLPRGIGISAYLSELYLREFDEKILKCPQVLFYARFVDDIIIVCTADQVNILRKLAFVKKSLKDIDLNLNKEKTDHKTLNGRTQKSIEYLGYHFLFGRGQVKIALAKSKIEKYKKRIKLSFDDYNKTVKSPNKKSESLLKKRVRFLTGNTRLVNNKKNALVGIYFTYNLITDISCLDGLDRYLENKINCLGNEKFKRILSELTFKSGFQKKRFHKFSTNDFRDIVRVWKYAA